MSEQASVKRGRRAVLALLLCIAAPFTWIPTLDVPWMRSTGLAAWLFLAIGLAIGWSALRADTRLRARILFGLDVLLLALFTFAFFGAARLPSAQRVQALGRAENFTLLDQDEHSVTLQENLARGPVLLVFYRGHW